MLRLCSGLAAALLVAAVGACGKGGPSAEDRAASAEQAPGQLQPVAEEGQPVVPPFEVRDELDGLLLIWFDEQGTHTAARRADVPEARRGRVRIDSLSVPPDKRLDPDRIYVADLRAPGKDGRYAVREHSRAWFEGQVLASRPKPAEPAESGDSGVTIYMASWCGACRAAASYLRSRNVPFAERDIEKDAAANSEMLRKARAAGKSPSGVPVIDFKGQLILGFDRARLAQLIDQSSPI